MAFKKSVYLLVVLLMVVLPVDGRVLTPLSLQQKKGKFKQKSKRKKQ